MKAKDPASTGFTSNPISFTAELLSDDEVAAITGYLTSSKQIQWLAANGWQHVLSGARRPVVGRLYARLKLAGLKPSETNTVTETWTFDLTRVS